MKFPDYLNKKILLFLLPIFMSGMPSVISAEDNSHFYSKHNKKEPPKLVKCLVEEDSLKDIKFSGKPREIKVNIALHNVSEDYSEKLLDYISDIYKKEFNISFKAVDFYKHNLPERWFINLEMEKIKNASKKKSDIYLLFSGRDWNNTDDSENYSVVGEAHDTLGYAWIETHNETSDRKNLTHEVAHLFGVIDNQDKCSFMNRELEGEIHFTRDMREKILKNKFKEWEFSRYVSNK